MNSTTFSNCYLNSDAFVMIVKFPSKATYIVHFAACILNVIITVTTVVLNLLTLLTFWRTPRLRKNILLYLVMILSMVDAGTGIFCYPLLTVRMIYELMETSNCWLGYLQSNLFRLSSIISLSLVSAISIERYFGVIHPLIHRTQVTKKRLLLLLGSVWSITTFPYVATLFINKPLKFIIATTLILLILLTIYAYTRIGFAVIQCKIRREGLLNANISHEEASNESARKNPKEKMNILRQLKMSKSSFLIALCYLCCYMPTLIFATAKANVSMTLRALASPWCLLCVMLNFCLNSVIFFWRNASLRKETMNVLRDMQKKRFK